MGIFFNDPQETSDAVEVSFGPLFRSLLTVILGGFFLDFSFAIFSDPYPGSGAGQEGGGIVLAAELFIMAASLLIVFPLCGALVPFCAKRGIWGYCSAAFAGAILGFVSAVISAFVLIGFGAQGNLTVGLPIYLIIGTHAAIVYGIPGALLLLYLLSRRKESLFLAVFGQTRMIRLSLYLMPIAFVVIWQSFIWRYLYEHPIGGPL